MRTFDYKNNPAQTAFSKRIALNPANSTTLIDWSNLTGTLDATIVLSIEIAGISSVIYEQTIDTADSVTATGFNNVYNAESMTIDYTPNGVTGGTIDIVSIFDAFKGAS